MKFPTIFSIAFVVTACLSAWGNAAPTPFHEIMQKREGFVLHSRPDTNTSHELVFALHQRNLDVLEKELMTRATPGTSKYLQWMSFEEIGALIANPTAFDVVTSWLNADGIKASWVSKRKEYIKATASVETWGKLLSTQFFNYRDENPFSRLESDELVIRTREYTLPEALTGHVDTIFNTVQPIPIIHKGFHTKKGSPYRVDARIVAPAAKDSAREDGKGGSDDGAPSIVTVEYLNSFYDISSNLASASAILGQSVFEEEGMSFAQTDLNQFQVEFGLTQQAAEDIGGGSVEASDCSFDTCGEGSLDIQYIMGVSQTTISTYYYVGGLDPFVTWVTDLANDENPPKSNSMSWGAIEQDLPTSVLNSFNTEAMKLGALGVTVTISSGDNGVSNSGCNCLNNSGSSQSSWSGSGTWSGVGYFPNFPASNPYVTAIGATMGPGGLPPANAAQEIVCQSQEDGVITSGGGFSTFFSTPTWQTSFVSSYFAGLTSANTPAPGFNKNGRGLPDMSMVGVWYQVVVDGVTQSVFGTSCSSPVTAALVSLVNAARLNKGLGPVGYMNPTLYSSPGSFNDITVGSNNCCENGDIGSATTCCNSGFTATAGWDPTTGLGSITLPKLGALYEVTL